MFIVWDFSLHGSLKKTVHCRRYRSTGSPWTLLRSNVPMERLEFLKQLSTLSTRIWSGWRARWWRPSARAIDLSTWLSESTSQYEHKDVNCKLHLRSWFYVIRIKLTYGTKLFSVCFFTGSLICTPTCGRVGRWKAVRRCTLTWTLLRSVRTRRASIQASSTRYGEIVKEKARKPHSLSSGGRGLILEWEAQIDPSPLP